MAKHHPDLIFCRKQPGVGKFNDLKKYCYCAFLVQCNTLLKLGNILFCSYWAFMWKMWWKMRHLWLLRTSLYFSSNLWRMQLRLIPGTMCYLRWSGGFRCILLQRMHYSRKGCKFYYWKYL